MVASAVHLEFDITNTRYRLVNTTNFLTTYGLNVATYGMKITGTLMFNNAIYEQHLTAIDPFINLQAGDNVSAWNDLPLDENGEVVNGTWTGTFNVRAVGTGLSIFSFALTGSIMTTIQDELASFFIAGNTFTVSGGANSGVKTISTATDVGANLQIVTVEALVNQGPVGDTWAFDLINPSGTLTHAYTGCTEVAATATMTSDCDSGDNGTLTYEDTTPYAAAEQTLVSRSAVITPPAYAVAAGIAAVTTTESSYTFTQLATLTWELTLTNVLSYTQDDGLVVSYTASLTKEYKVTCAGTLCGLNPCIETLSQAHDAELLANTVSKYQRFVDKIALLYIEALNYKQCLEYDNYRAKIAEIEEVLEESQCECTCCDDEVARLIYNTSSDSQTAIEQIQDVRQFFLRNGVPTVNQDSSQGYAIGAIIENINTGILYRATDVTVGAAVWGVYYNPNGTLQYTSYVVRLTQSGVLSPADAIVLDQFGLGPILWARTVAGNYTGTLVGAFTLDKTMVSVINNRITGGFFMSGVRVSNDVILLNTRNNAAANADGVLSETFVKIDVFA